MNSNIKFGKDEILIGDYRIEISGYCDYAKYEVYKGKKHLVSPDRLDKAVNFCLENRTKCEHLNKSDPSTSVTKKAYCWDCGKFLEN